MNKVIKDGNVAVLYSPGYGAGWYSWNQEHKECLFDPEIVEIIMQQPELGRRDRHGNEVSSKISDIADSKWKDFYSGGACDLQVQWIEEGEEFEVTEYDGYESINVIGKCTYLVA